MITPRDVLAAGEEWYAREPKMSRRARSLETTCSRLEEIIRRTGSGDLIRGIDARFCLAHDIVFDISGFPPHLRRLFYHWLCGELLAARQMQSHPYDPEHVILIAEDCGDLLSERVNA